MSLKILVVDDEKDIADLVEIYLRNENYTVYKYYNSKDAEIDKITGLTLGADDYVTKPFRPLELMARINFAGALYQALFSISSYTRNGFFYAPIFL